MTARAAARQGCRDAHEAASALKKASAPVSVPGSRAERRPPVRAAPMPSPQAGSLAALDKATAKMDDAKKKKLEEAVQAAAGAARGGRPAPAAAPAAAAAPARPALPTVRAIGSASARGSKAPSVSPGSAAGQGVGHTWGILSCAVADQRPRLHEPVGGACRAEECCIDIYPLNGFQSHHGHRRLAARRPRVPVAARRPRPARRPRAPASAAARPTRAPLCPRRRAQAAVAVAAAVAQQQEGLLRTRRRSAQVSATRCFLIAQSALQLH